MKQLIIRLSLCLFFAISIGVTKGQAQQKLPFPKKHEIKSSQILTKQKGAVSVKQVSAKSLKNGYNYLVLDSGSTVFVEVRSGKIKRMSLVNKAGEITGTVTITGTATQFECGRQLCQCTGDADCNDMFTTNVCGPNAMCFGETCICAR